MAEGGDLNRSRMNVDVTMEEMKLLETIRFLELRPKIESPEDMDRISEAFGGKRREQQEPKKEPKDRHDDRHEDEERDDDRPILAPRPGNQYPKLGNFFGEEGKGDVSWKTFKYEIEALRSQEFFTPEQIAIGIRRATKGAASDKVRRMGPEVSLDEMMKKLERDYGNIESKETILMKFYTCSQKSNETLESYSSRAEELFEQAISLGALRRSDTITLKGKLHAGLNKELKHMSMYLMQGDMEYDAFKIELRRLETTLVQEAETKGSVPCKPAVSTNKSSSADSEMKGLKDEMRQLFKQLTERMEQIEKGQQQGGVVATHYTGRGGRRGRGNYTGNRGRGQYQPQRPTGFSTFQPNCYHCNKKGHTKKDCPTLLATMVCFKCHKTGHRQRECPN